MRGAPLLYPEPALFGLRRSLPTSIATQASTQSFLAFQEIRSACKIGSQNLAGQIKAKESAETALAELLCVGKRMRSRTALLTSMISLQCRQQAAAS